MINRRRALTILAGVAALPALGVKAQANTARWSGVALGAKVQIVLDHPNAKQLIAKAVDEIHRLEAIFSLYKPNSQLSHLNRDGVLIAPALDMVELFSICTQLHARTKGAFDPTVQTLWALYAQQISAGTTPTAQQITQALAITGWQHVTYAADKISFNRPDVKITLNGIAQGFIADKITNLFRRQGIKSALINTGEISAIGNGPNGRAWPVKLGHKDGQSLPLSNMSIATSSPLGTTFDTGKSTGKSIGHIIDPRDGHPKNLWSQISVITQSAAQADGLSTAFCLMSKPEISAVKEHEQVFLS